MLFLSIVSNLYKNSVSLTFLLSKLIHYALTQYHFYLYFACLSVIFVIDFVVIELIGGIRCFRKTRGLYDRTLIWLMLGFLGYLLLWIRLIDIEFRLFVSLLLHLPLIIERLSKLGRDPFIGFLVFILFTYVIVCELFQRGALWLHFRCWVVKILESSLEVVLLRQLLIFI
jgi:hypothetical protein